MASFHSKTFTKHDDYMTPSYAWDNIKQYIPKDKVIWECFYGDGMSGKDLTKLGFNVIHKEVDFFENDLGDVIVSNPPFSQTKQVLTRMKELQKPFILIMPSSKINTQSVRGLFGGDDELQIIIPRKRIHFEKHIDGVVPNGWKSVCNFDCFYYCWKMKLPKSLIWLE